MCWLTAPGRPLSGKKSWRRSPPRADGFRPDSRMPTLADLRLLADYNAWINPRLYQAAALPAADAAAPRGAFFGSLLGTLNHIAVGDILWLTRFADHPAGYPALDPVRVLPMRSEERRVGKECVRTCGSRWSPDH